MSAATVGLGCDRCRDTDGRRCCDSFQGWMREEGLQGALSKREGPYRTQFPDNYKKKGKFVQVCRTIMPEPGCFLSAS